MIKDVIPHTPRLSIVYVDIFFTFHFSCKTFISEWNTVQMHIEFVSTGNQDGYLSDFPAELFSQCLSLSALRQAKKYSLADLRGIASVFTRSQIFIPCL